MEPLGPFSRDCGGNALIIAAHEIQRAIAMLALTNGADLLLETDDRNRPRAIIVPRRTLDPLYAPVMTNTPDPMAAVVRTAWNATAGKCELCGPNIAGHAETCPYDAAYVLFRGPDRPRFTPDPIELAVDRLKSARRVRDLAFRHDPPIPATDTPLDSSNPGAG